MARLLKSLIGSIQLLALAALASEGESAATEVRPPRAVRLTPSEIPWSLPQSGVQAGSSMQPGVQSVIVFGDASRPTLYSVMFKVGPHAAIPAHSHPDDRSCFVTSGVWYFGYGEHYAEAALRALPPGSHYTELAHQHHFAGTKAEGAVVACTAVGPAGTTFAQPTNDPRR